MTARIRRLPPSVIRLGERVTVERSDSPPKARGGWAILWPTNGRVVVLSDGLTQARATRKGVAAARWRDRVFLAQRSFDGDPLLVIRAEVSKATPEQIAFERWAHDLALSLGRVSEDDLQQLTSEAVGQISATLESGESIDVAIEGYATMVANPPKKMVWAQQTEVERALDNVIAKTGRRLASLPKIHSRIASTFHVADKEAASLVARHHSFWLRDAHGRIAHKASAKAREILEEGILQGWDRRELATRLSQMTFGAMRQEWYYETVAANLVGRARAYSHGRVYEAAGITEYRIQAVLDDRTTNTCEFLHNKILPVGDAMNRVRATLNSPNPEAVLWNQPFTTETDEGIYIARPGQPARQIAEIIAPSSGASPYGPSGVYHSALSTQDYVDAGVGFPPYHHRCRTTTIPVL